MMTGWLKLTDDQRRETLAQAQAESGIVVRALEKDWWVTLTLKALFQSSYKQWMVFKGGTSLSKGWRLINRFSEDIDIAFDPAAFGLVHRDRPSKNFIEQLKRHGCAFTSSELLSALQNEFSMLGVPGGAVIIEAETIPANRPDTDPQTIRIRYRSLFDPNPYLINEVRVEVSARSLLAPFARKPISSLLFSHFPNPAYEEGWFEVAVAEPRKTFLEKAFLLHEEFAKPDKAQIRYHRMTRHFYDLVLCQAAGMGSEALKDKELYEHLVQHRKYYSRLPWMDYGMLRRETLSFLPPTEMIDLYKADYDTMLEHMIYGDAPRFEQVMLDPERLQGLFRKNSPVS